MDFVRGFCLLRQEFLRACKVWGVVVYCGIFGFGGLGMAGGDLPPLVGRGEVFRLVFRQFDLWLALV